MLGPRVTLDKSQVLANHFQKVVGTLYIEEIFSEVISCPEYA